MDISTIDDGQRFDVGVIVGRFQVPDLHEAHLQIIKTVKSRHKNTLILVGVAVTLGTKENPLPYVLRLQMLQEYFPSLVIAPILDVPNHKEWSKQLDLLVRTHFPLGSVRLYGGRDSFIKCYHGTFPTFEYPCITHPDGTEIREDAGRTYLNNPYFRQGVIWASQNQYPKVYPTVDIAVWKREEDIVQVAMGRRSLDSFWRFPGGFVDPTDETLELAAKRELHEELGLTCESDMLYVGSFQVNDWRYRTPDQRILTSLFMIEHFAGPLEKNEEFHEVDWISLHETDIEEIEPGHREMFETLKKKIKCKGVAKTKKGEKDEWND